MFKIIAEPLVWWPVTFPGVTEDGEVVENKIEVRFVILDEDAMEAFSIETGKLLASKLVGENEEVLAPEDRPTSSAVAQQALQPIVRDWRGVAAENGEPLPFSVDNFRALLRVPNVFAAILRSYGACRAGRAEVRSGN